METCAITYQSIPDILPLIDICGYLSETIKDKIPMRTFLSVYRLLHRHHRLALTSAKLMRDHLNACEQDCPDAPCLKLAAPSIRVMRDGLSIIVDLVNRHTLFILERKPALEAFEAWDDLLDDCTVFADPDIKAAIMKRAAEASTMIPSKDWRKELYDI